MKIILLSFACVLSLFSYSQKRSYAHPDIDVLQYHYQVELNDANDTLKMTAEIRFRVLNNNSAVLIDLASLRADGKGMRVKSVTEDDQPVAFVHAENILKIALSTHSPEQRTIQINYKGIPADGLIISKNKYKQRTFFSDNWPDRAHNWLACVDHPSDKAPVDFIVKAPVRYQVVSNGSQLEESNLPGDLKLTHWSEKTALPVKVMGIGVAEFAVQQVGSVANGNAMVPVSTWVYPQDRTKGFYDYAVAADILPFFIKNVGPYPYRKLANIESKTIFGGMENAGAIFYSESSVTGTREMEELAAHEIAHQWFGDMATEADWPHVWLSEGFATYLSMMYMESKYGRQWLVKELEQNRKKVIAYSNQRIDNGKYPGPIVDSSITDYMELLNINTYKKGGWILHMLRRQMGDSLFWKGISNYYEQYAGRNAVTEDFKKVMETVSGKNLNRFFHQWLYTSGHPVLSIKKKYEKDKKQLTVTVTQQQEFLFQFPLVIQVEGTGEDGNVFRPTMIKDKQAVISFPLNNPPVKVVIDPYTALLFEEAQ